jgi:hypothetical protein
LQLQEGAARCIRLVLLLALHQLVGRLQECCLQAAWGHQQQYQQRQQGLVGTP